MGWAWITSTIDVTRVLLAMYCELLRKYWVSTWLYVHLLDWDIRHCFSWWVYMHTDKEMILKGRNQGYPKQTNPNFNVFPNQNVYGDPQSYMHMQNSGTNDPIEFADSLLLCIWTLV